MPELEKKIQIEAVEGTDYAIPVLDASQVKNIDTYVEGKVSAGIATVIGGATEAMDTLKEVEDYINSTSGQGASGLIAQVNSLGDTVVGLQGDVQTLQGQMSSKANINQIPDVTGFATKTELQTAIAGVSGGSGTSTPVVISGDSADVFKINGEAYTEGEVVLEAQGTYTLSGKLHGHIIIGHNELTKYVVTTDENPADISAKDYYTYANGEYTVAISKGQQLAGFEPGVTYYEEGQYDKTKLILNDFELISDREIGILYDEEVKSLEILLEKNTENKIVCEVLGVSTELSSNAAILSNNSLKIVGLGKLELLNNYGSHGIKAEHELEISGKPVIAIDNGDGHDCIHGSNGIIIHNGKITAKHGKDGLGTGDNGSIKIYAGEFRFEGNAQSDMDSKIAGYIYNSDWVEISGSRILDGVSVYSESGVGEVRKADGVVTAVEGVYTLTGDEGAEFDLSGVINGDILSAVRTTNIVLNGVYLRGNIRYTADKKRVSIELAENTINIIEGRILSTNNIEIKGKGTLYIKSDENTIDGSTVSIRGDGDRYIKSKGYSIKGTEVLIGDEASDSDILVAKDINKDSDQNIYAGKVYARLNSDGTKKGIFVIYENQKGYVLLEKVQYEPLSGYHGNGSNIQCDKKILFIGKIEEKKFVLEDFDFNGNSAVLEDGTYKVINPINSPFEGEDGILTVATTKEGDTIQSWSSRSYSAHRVAGMVDPIKAGLSALTVNNESIDVSVLTDSYRNGVQIKEVNIYGKKGVKKVRTVSLEAGGTYELSGALTNVRIEVEGVAGTTTKIILAGLYIHFTDDVDTEDEENAEAFAKAAEPMITSAVEGHTLEIEVKAGTNNYLRRDLPLGRESFNHSTGVIFTQFDDTPENLIISGSGYLSIYSMLGGHGIKAKGTLTIKGLPHIRTTAYHDVIHGNMGLVVEGGYFYVDYCNDVFGSDTADGDQNVGTITIKTGDFTIIHCNETVIQADNVRVYPNVRIHYKDVGEGMYLQCKPGTTRTINGSGLVNGYYTLDYANEKFVCKALKTAVDWFEFDINNLGAYPVKKVKYDLSGIKGIVVYKSGSVEPDISAIAGGTYAESSRNTPIATFEYTELPAGETLYPALPENDQPFPAVEVVDFATRVYAGTWNVGVSKQVLEDYKIQMDYILKCLETKIVPPKSITLLDYQLTDKDGISGDITELTTADEMVALDDNTKVVVEAGGNPYNSKNVEKYPTDSRFQLSVTLYPKELYKIHANIEPLNVTNNQIKWSVAGKSEKMVIGRTKGEDLDYCTIQGLAAGDEFIILSAKGLTSKNEKVQYTIHFHVEDGERIYGKIGEQIVSLTNVKEASETTLQGKFVVTLAAGDVFKFFDNKVEKLSYTAVTAGEHTISYSKEGIAAVTNAPASGGGSN